MQPSIYHHIAKSSRDVCPRCAAEIVRSIAPSLPNGCIVCDMIHASKLEILDLKLRLAQQFAHRIRRRVTVIWHSEKGHTEIERKWLGWCMTLERLNGGKSCQPGK